MTNLEIIKYLVLNNPTRLGQLLEDIHCCAWMDGINDRLGDESALPLMTEWIYETASTRYHLYKDEELKEWFKDINYVDTLEVFYGDKYKVISQAIDEIKLLETLL